MQGTGTFLQTAAGAILAMGLIMGAASQARADQSMIGGNLSVGSEVDGDVNLVGGNLTIDAIVDGDVKLIGGQIDIQGDISGNVRAVGGDITVDAAIGNDLSIAGGDITLSDRTSVGGEARVAGGDVTIGGTVGDDLEVAAGDLRLNARVEGDAELSVNDLTFGPDARIEGDLLVRGRERPEVPDGVVGGSFEYEFDSGFNASWRAPFIGWSPHQGQSFGGAVIMTLWAFVGGLVLIFLFPGLTERSIRTLRARPLRSLVYGFGFIILLPLAAALLMATVIGLPIGLFLLVLYPFLLFAGYVSAALWASRLTTRDQDGALSRGRQLGFLAVALVIIAVLSVVPVIGSIVTVGLLVIGVGAFGAALFGGRRADPAAGAPV